VSEDARAAVLSMFSQLYQRRGDHFGNGRFVRTPFESAIDCRAARLAPDLDAATRIITATDILRHRVSVGDAAAHVTTRHVTPAHEWAHQLSRHRAAR
jgi:hypothetical protein